MKKIEAFHPEEPGRLASELHRFEENVSREFTAQAATAATRPTWDDWLSVGPVPATYDRIARLDTATSAIAATLPTVSPDTRSRPVGIVRKGSNNITLVPLDSTATIDGSASVTLSTDGLYLYVHDGENWYRI